MERLQKIISNSGYCSRRKAEELIEQGLVKVNGTVIYELGTKVNTNDLIEVNNYILKNENKVYYLLNKPRGVITSTSDEKGRKTVIDLIKTNVRIYPIGRLDYDTTGALILTNDGELANLIMHPKSNIDKVYIAKINGLIGKNQLLKLQNGVIIDGVKTSKAKARIKSYDKKTDTSIVEIIIHEGKNHQVKKMFKALGYDVLKLKRERIAFLDINNLKSGEYRMLNPKEVKKLYNEATK
jgi:23S rRNA pseudouridine2605 synthase